MLETAGDLVKVLEYKLAVQGRSISAASFEAEKFQDKSIVRVRSATSTSSNSTDSKACFFVSCRADVRTVVDLTTKHVTDVFEA